GGGRVTPDDAHTMVRCGVNLIGLDNLRPFDPRLLAEIWSWASNEPSAAGYCAYQDATGFFHSDNCRQRRRAACLIGSRFVVTNRTEPWWNATKQCARMGAKFA